MRIITVNLPVSYLTFMDKLIGEKALYPSRSELIRVAVREFLINELESAQKFVELQKQMDNKKQTILDEKKILGEKYIKIPGDNPNEYKVYRIVRKEAI